jgi:hypothetical protein
VASADSAVCSFDEDVYQLFRRHGRRVRAIKEPSAHESTSGSELASKSIEHLAQSSDSAMQSSTAPAAAAVAAGAGAPPSNHPLVPEFDIASQLPVLSPGTVGSAPTAPIPCAPSSSFPAAPIDTVLRLAGTEDKQYVLPPVYFQRQGHSNSVVGVIKDERTGCGYLLIMDSDICSYGVQFLSWFVRDWCARAEGTEPPRPPALPQQIPRDSAYRLATRLMSYGGERCCSEAELFALSFVIRNHVHLRARLFQLLFIQPELMSPSEQRHAMRPHSHVVSAVDDPGVEYANSMNEDSYTIPIDWTHHKADILDDAPCRLVGDVWEDAG